MSKKQVHSFSSVISINPYSNTYTTANATILDKTTKLEFDKLQRVISYLNTKEFINAQITLSKNIPEDDLYDAIYSKAYDELGLDQAIEYKIGYIEIVDYFKEDLKTFWLFVIDPSMLIDLFRDSLNGLKFIDKITPNALLYRSLYTKELLESYSTECFIYFSKKDTFITIYKNSEFIYTKSINYSLEQLHEKYQDLSGEIIEYQSFINMLSSIDLKNDSSDKKLHIIKVYKEAISSVNDILTYAKRALELDKIHHVYIDTEILLKSKLSEIAEVELGIKSSTFNFRYNFNSNTYVEPMHYLAHLNSLVSGDSKYDLNFSIFHRPPNFKNRESGKAIILGLVALFLAFLYPLGYFGFTYAKDLQYKILENEYNELHSTKIERESTINTKEAQKQKTQALFNEQESEYAQKKATLLKIEEVKVRYPMKAELVDTLTKELAKFDVKVEGLIYSEIFNKDSANLKELNLELVSLNDKKITGLIEHLTKAYENRYSFSIENINFKEESKKYFGTLKVSLK